MDYLGERLEAYEHPRHVLDGARSLLVLAAAYRTAEPHAPGPGQGRVSRYAWGADYHRLIRTRLHRLADFHRQLVPQAAVRGVIDTAPLLERDFAQLAGLGWIGKNTLLLNRQLGSLFFLAVLLTTEELVYDEPFVADHCGTCRACLDACPTQALVEPYRLDARRCISYLTIELREAIPEELRTGVGAWLFGCDVCQEVCPWNRRAPLATEPGFEPLEGMNPVELAALFDLDEAGFRARFGRTPLARPKRAGILRNAAIVLGNRRDRAALPALEKGLEDANSVVREACAWAIQRCRGDGGGMEPQMNTDEHRS
jgi:epoxyqueuosine reductase